MSLVLLSATSNLTDKGLAELIGFIDNYNLEWVYLAVGLIYISSVAITWVIGTRKSRVEIEKLKLENSNLKMDITEKCKVARKKYLDELEKIQLLLRLMIQYVQLNDIQNTKESREDLKQTLTGNLIPLFIDYIDVYELSYEKRSYKRKEFVENEVIKFLETMVKFNEAINNPNILNKINTPEFKVTWSSLSSIIAFIDENMAFYKIGTKKKLNVLLANLDILNLRFHGYFRGLKK